MAVSDTRGNDNSIEKRKKECNAIISLIASSSDKTDLKMPIRCKLAELLCLQLEGGRVL